MNKCYRCGSRNDLQELDGPYGHLWECNECFLVDQADQSQWELDTRTIQDENEMERVMVGSR